MKTQYLTRKDPKDCEHPEHAILSGTSYRVTQDKSLYYKTETCQQCGTEIDKYPISKEVFEQL